MADTHNLTEWPESTHSHQQLEQRSLSLICPLLTIKLMLSRTGLEICLSWAGMTQYSRNGCGAGRTDWRGMARHHRLLQREKRRRWVIMSTSPLILSQLRRLILNFHSQETIDSGWNVIGTNHSRAPTQQYIHHNSSLLEQISKIFRENVPHYMFYKNVQFCFMIVCDRPTVKKFSEKSILVICFVTQSKHRIYFLFLCIWEQINNFPPSVLACYPRGILRTK